MRVVIVRLLEFKLFIGIVLIKKATNGFLK